MSREGWQWSREIKALRQERGWTQKARAARLGVTKKIVADWEQGRQEPSLRRYIQLAKIAGGAQALWFLEWIGLDRELLAELVDCPKEAGSTARSLHNEGEERWMTERREDDRVTVGFKELTLINSLTLTALVELLEEKGILTHQDVLERMRAIRDRRKPS